jgi:hypothetical protein
MVTVSLLVPAAVREWFKGSMLPTDGQHHMTEVLELYRETNQPTPALPHDEMQP